MGYWTLLKRNPRTIGFGFLTAFFSGPGQTHFISIFSPFILASYGLTNTEYGSLYSLVTLASGILITFVGPLVDRYDIRLFSLFIGIGLILSQSFLLISGNVFFLGLGLFGLRFFGQGLGSSVSSIAVARFFNEARGKALSLSQMGFPFYEGLITPLAAMALTAVSFQNFSLTLIATVAVLYIPLCLSLTKSIPSFNVTKDHIEPSTLDSLESPQKHWTRKDVFTDKTIYLLMPQTLMPPFALTGLLFHQAAIANIKGWSLSLMAAGLAFFAFGRVINTFITGPLVDKYSASRLFPYYQVPLTFGFLSLALLDHTWTPALAFTFFGLTVGSGGPIKSAIWAELYGTRFLGALKSAFGTIMVFSTAISPALFGYILDQQKSVMTLLIALSLITIAANILSLLALKDFAKEN